MSATALRALVSAALLFGAVACSESPSTPEDEASSATDVELDAAFTESPIVDRDGRPRDHRGTLDYLARLALRKLAEARGPEPVERIRQRLGGLADDVKAAHESGDRAAFESALRALRTAKAQAVVRVLGPQVSRRAIHHAVERIRRLGERLETAAPTDHDLTRARRILGAASALARRARQALADGNPVEALLLATRALDLLAAIH